MLKKIRNWYEGEIIPDANDPNSSVVFIGWHTERHWTAKIARAVVEFYLREWKWIFGTLIAVASLAMAYTKLG